MMMNEGIKKAQRKITELFYILLFNNESYDT